MHVFWCLFVCVWFSVCVCVLMLVLMLVRVLVRVVVGRCRQRQVPQPPRVHPRMAPQDRGLRMRGHAGEHAGKHVRVVHRVVLRRRGRVRVDGGGREEVGGVVRAGREAGGVGGAVEGVQVGV